MRLFRLASRRHDPLSGLGAARFGGRWNSPGRPMVYTSEHLSLAVLEGLVHIDQIEDWPADRRYWEYELDDELTERLDRAELPDRWSLQPRVTREIGDDFLVRQRTPAMVVPSVVVPIESNVLLNPEHPELRRMQLLNEEDFSLDPRLPS